MGVLAIEVLHGLSVFAHAVKVIVRIQWLIKLVHPLMPHPLALDIGEVQVLIWIAPRV
jgi:hypothetical protein